MAGGGEKFGLGNIGGVGLALGAGERDVEQCQFLGAFAHAPFQGFVRALQRLGGLDARRDVGEGGDDAAVRHVIGAHLDHHAGFGEALHEQFLAGDVAFNLRAHDVFDALRRDVAALAVEAQDIGERHADADQVRRQIENFAELPVPADQL